MDDVAHLEQVIDLLEQNARVQAKLLADTGRQRDAMKAVLEQAKTAMLRTRTASIAGCEEGYGKPEKWADELFSSHADLTASIKAIDVLLVGVGPSGDRS